MYCRRPNYLLSVIFAIIIGIAIASILYYIPAAVITILLWIGLGLAVLLLISLLYIVTRTGNSAPTPIARCLIEDGNFFAVSIIGTIITAAVALALSALLVAATTSLPILLLIFLFGFFFGGMLISLLVILLGVLAAPRNFNAGNPPCGPIAYRP